MNNRNKALWLIGGTIFVVLVTVGLTYAYWLVTKTQTEKNLITSACLDISISNEANDIKLEEQYPISDEEGALLTPYEFTVTNNCNTSVDYQIALESLGDEETSVSSDALKVMLDKTAPIKLSEGTKLVPAIENAFASNSLGTNTIEAKGSITHELRIWVAADASISEMNKTFRSKITATVGQGIVNGVTLGESILAQYGGKYNIVELKGFANPSLKGEANMYKALDDDGTSYYLRGDVTNNYVKLGILNTPVYTYDLILNGNFWGHFEDQVACDLQVSEMTSAGAEAECVTKTMIEAGDPMYWRIVRINGDGSIRLVYDGTSLVDNYAEHESIIGFSYYSNTSYKNSEVQKMAEKWYVSNLKSDYSKYLADSTFCNDIGEFMYVDDAIQSVYTYSSYRVRYSLPDLTCFEGNLLDVESGKINYPIGLLSADEVIVSGKSNTSYLYNSKNAWTMTASDSSYVGGSDSMYVYNSTLSGSVNSSGVRPVINIKADTLFKGNGTIDTPYEIVMN